MLCVANERERERARVANRSVMKLGSALKRVVSKKLRDGAYATHSFTCSPLGSRRRSYTSESELRERRRGAVSAERIELAACGMEIGQVGQASGRRASPVS